jgi:hypothetical protein
MALLARAAAAVALAVGLGVAAARATCSTSAPALAVACTAPALSAPYVHVDSVQGFGCEGGFGYLWMTVGRGVGEVGVTEVVRYDARAARWVNASRLYYCAEHRVPPYVYHWGCTSN